MCVTFCKYGVLLLHGQSVSVVFQAKTKKDAHLRYNFFLELTTNARPTNTHTHHTHAKRERKIKRTKQKKKSKMQKCKKTKTKKTKKKRLEP